MSEEIGRLLREARKAIEERDFPAALYGLADAIERLTIAKGLAAIPAPSCARCEADEHDRCGGVESGCGCAARDYFEESPAAWPSEVKSKAAIYAALSDVIGLDRDEVEDRFYAAVFAGHLAGQTGDLAHLLAFATAALRLAGRLP